MFAPTKVHGCVFISLYFLQINFVDFRNISRVFYIYVSFINLFTLAVFHIIRNFFMDKINF